MSPDQWLASQQEEKPKGANVTIESAPVAELSPDQWLATQKTKAPTTSLSPDQWLAQQPQQPQETKTSNPFKGLAARAANLVGEGVEGVARSTLGLGERMEGALTPEEKAAMEESRKQSPKFVQGVLKKGEDLQQGLFDFSKNIKDWGKDIGYAPSTTLGELPGKPLLLVPFIAERVISSSPDMVAAVGVAPAYIVARTNEILNDRLTNDSKPWQQATVGDVAASASAAVLETFLERLATKHLLPGGGFVGSTTAKRVGKETALQSGTEAVEEGIGYLGGAAGTVKGVDPSQMAQQMIEGAIVGGGLGAGVQGGKEYARTKFNDGTSQLGISDIGTSGETTGRIGGLDETGLDVSGERSRDNNGRKGAINDQLNELIGKQEQYAKFDPADPRIIEIDDTIKDLKAELQNIDLTPIPKEKAFNAPGIELQRTAKELKQTANEILDVHPNGGRNDGKGFIASKGNELGRVLLDISRKIKLFEDGVNELNSVIPDSVSPEQRAKREAARDRDQANIDMLNAQAEELLKTRQEVYNQDAAAGLLSSKTRAMNAPGQIGFDFTAPDENTKRTIDTTPSEFGLTAPEGKVDTSTEIKPINTPKFPTSKFMLVNTGNNPTKGLASFFNSIKPATNTEGETVAHKAEVNKLFEDINNFYSDAVGKDRDSRLKTVRDFFDQYSIAPEANQNAVSNLSKQLVGMNAQTQQNVLNEVSQLPKINTVRGMKELRNQLQETITNYSEAKLMRHRENAVLPYGQTVESTESITSEKDRNALQNLSNILDKYLSPEEKAAKNYFSAHADYDNPFLSAIRAAAFDLGAEIDPNAKFKGEQFKGQNLEAAQQFRNWVSKNLDKNTLARFDVTVEDFRKQSQKANRNDVVRWETDQTDKMGVSKEGAMKFGGWKMGKRTYVMHPSVETRIANNDLPGALRALTKVGNEFQKGLARKLLALNLTTTISVGKQDAFSQHIIEKNALNERTELVNLLKANFPTVFADHFSRLNDVKATLQSLSLLRDGKLKVPQETVNAYYGQIEIVFEAYQAASAVLDASGTYMVGLDSININRDRGGNTTATFLHEVLHAATHWAIDPVNYATLDKNQKQAVDELNRMYNIAKTMGTHGNELNSLDEFIVEAFTNPEFQAFLRTIPVANTKQTLWDKFVKLVAKVFGLQNMLGYTLANANTIMQAPPNNSTEARALNQKGKKSGYALNDTFHVGPEAKTFLDKTFSGAPTWNQVKDKIPELLRNMTEANRKNFLNVLTPRMMQDIIGNKLPALKDYIIETENMSVDRSRIEAEVGEIAKKWTIWQKKNPGLATILNNLMIDSSRLFIDPSKNNSDPTLNAAWKDIGTTGREIYIEARNFFTKRRNAFNTAVLDNIKQNLMSDGKMTEAEAKADPLYVEAKAQQDKHVIDPYFPFKRFGQFWYQVNSAGGKVQEFQQFESEQERTDALNERREQLQRTGSTSVIKQGNSIREAVNENLQNLQALKNIKKMIVAGQGQSTTKLKENLINDAEELYLSILPDQSVRKLFNRQGIPGVNPDMLRAFASTGFHMAYQQARFQHSNNLFRHIQGAKAYLNGMPDKEALPLRDYIAAFEKNLDNVLNPPNTHWSVSAVSDVSFIYYLSSPASALVNILGVPATSFPTVAARYGYTKTAQKMFIEYPAKFLTAGFTGPDGKTTFPSLKNNFDSLSKVQQDAFIALEHMFNITLTHDIAGLTSGPSKNYTGGWKGFMKVITGLFHGAEKFNREVVGMATFDLAYERAIAGGVTPKRAFEKAVAIAKELTYKSMGDYSTENKPVILQNQFAKVIGQYKQFPLTMTYLLVRSGIEGFGGNFKKTDTAESLTKEIAALQDSIDTLDSKDPNLKAKTKTLEANIEALTTRANQRKDLGLKINAELGLDNKPVLKGADLEKAITKSMLDFKREGMNRLMGTLAITTIMFNGVTGMFGWSAFSALMEAMHYMWADEEEKEAPFDFDNWFKNWAVDTFGGAVGDSIARGAISTATGINVADRMSLNGMWFRDPRSSGDEVATAQAYFIGMLGPTVGLALDTVPNAVKQFNDGHLGRAIETALPAFIKNIVKAKRFATEGALSLGGDELIPDFSAAEIGAQAIGFAPERLTRVQKANIETKSAEQDIIKRHDDLLNSFFMAVDTSDDDMKERILEKIGNFNTANPGKAITPKGILASIKRRYTERARAQGTGGAHIDKKLVNQLGGMRDYVDTED